MPLFYRGDTMYYKVLKDGKVIDVLDNIVYVKHQKKHDIMLICDKAEAQAILSSDGAYCWHEASLNSLNGLKIDTVELEEIDVYDYNYYKAFNGKSPEEIIDEYTLSLIEKGML